jgi:hypothetical protein
LKKRRKEAVEKRLGVWRDFALQLAKEGGWKGGNPDGDVPHPHTYHFERGLKKNRAVAENLNSEENDGDQVSHDSNEGQEFEEVPIPGKLASGLINGNAIRVAGSGYGEPQGRDDTSDTSSKTMSHHLEDIAIKNSPSLNQDGIKLDAVIPDLEDGPDDEL